MAGRWSEGDGGAAQATTAMLLALISTKVTLGSGGGLHSGTCGLLGEVLCVLQTQSPAGRELQLDLAQQTIVLETVAQGCNNLYG